MKKVLSIILIISICLNISTSIKVSANTNITLTGVNDRVLGYEKGEEPITFAGRVCIPYTVFSRDLGIFTIYNEEKKVLTMYDFNHIVTFDIYASTIQDENLNMYEGSAFFRGDVVYVPAEIVANIFELTYSAFSSKTDIVRIKNSDAYLNDEVFKALADASYDAMQNSANDNLSEYIGPQEDDLLEEELDEEKIIHAQIEVITPFFKSEISKNTLDDFEENGLTYFVDQTSFSSTEHIRYAYIKNYSIGIYVPKDVKDIRAYIEETNNKILDILGMKTRIIMLEDQTKESSVSDYIIANVDYDDYYTNIEFENGDKTVISIDLSNVDNIGDFFKYAKDQKIKLEKIDEFNH